MSDHAIELKGNLFPLSVLFCQDLSVANLKSELQQKLAQAPGFFHLAPVVISVDNLTEVPDFTAIKQLFVELQLVLVGVCGANAELKKAAHAAGLAALQMPKNSKAPEAPKSVAPAPTAPAAPTVIVAENRTIEQNIRSG